MRNGVISLEKWCKENNRLELLVLYDQKANLLPASEIARSSGKKYKFKCPVCKISWEQSPNKLARLRKHDYNVIKKRHEKTSCPYCSGERFSSYYNLAIVDTEARKWWDAERNSDTMETVLPNSHKKFYLRCPKCGYQLPNMVRIGDRKGTLRCPICGDGKNTQVTEKNCLQVTDPKIANELDDARNDGITGRKILPSYNGKLWFICPNGHHYKARVSNRTYLGRGCPICNHRNKTSFIEQAFRFYIQKCTSDIRSCQDDLYTKQNIDILLPSQRIAIEFNSLYYHSNTNERRRMDSDIKKLYTLAQYYRVFVIVENGEEFPLLDYPLIHPIPVPIFQLKNDICGEFNHIILELLKNLFPDRDSYPSINIMRDQLSILQQYVHVPIENSFEKKYPLLAQDWHPTMNGNLTPSMFAPTSVYKFYWVCRTCKRTYRATMGNRRKINPDTCHFCHNKSRYKSQLLCENYPFLKRFWSEKLNTIPFSQIAVASEKYGIFELLDGRIVPIRINNLSNWLYNNPNRNVEDYLNYCWEKLQKSLQI